MWTIFLKVFIEFITILLLLYVLVSGPRDMWNLNLQPGVKPNPLHWGEILTIGPPGKSHPLLLQNLYII